jgi:predicted enzyme related to lactoylglutathione lyase
VTALAFYQRLFGWQLRTPIDMGGGFQYQVFGLDRDFGGAYTIPADRAMPPCWCPYASSASADETAAKVGAAGGQLVHGPVDVPGGGRITQFFDAQHALFAVHSMAAPATTAASAAPPKAAVKAAAPAGSQAPAKAKSKAQQPAKKKAKKKPKKKATKKAAKRPARKAARKAKRKPARKGKRKPARKRARPAKRKAARKK